MIYINVIVNHGDAHISSRLSDDCKPVIDVILTQAQADITKGGAVSKAMFDHYAMRPRGPLKDWR